MVAQALPRQARTSAFARAMARAQAEKLVAYPNQDGTWTCKAYTIAITGRRCDDVACSCTAGRNDTICKHAVCVVAARKWGVRPVRPSLGVVPSTPAEVAEKARLVAEVTHELVAFDAVYQMPVSLAAARSGLR